MYQQTDKYAQCSWRNVVNLLRATSNFIACLLLETRLLIFTSQLFFILLYFFLALALREIFVAGGRYILTRLWLR